MSINVEKIVSEDLFVENNSLLFDRQRAARRSDAIPRIGAVTFIAIKSDPFQKLKDLAFACGKEALSFVARTRGKDSRTWLFVADGPWKQATGVVRHKKLWSNHRDLLVSGASIRMSDEVAIEVGGQVRFAGLLEMTDDLAESSIELVRADSACAVIASNNARMFSESGVRQIFDYAFPKAHGIQQTSIDWMKFAINLCPQGDVC